MANVVNSTSKKSSSIKAQGLTKLSTGNVRHSITKEDAKECMKGSDLQVQKKTCIPSAFAIPETPKLKIKQYCTQYNLSCGSDNTVACVPETPLLS